MTHEQSFRNLRVWQASMTLVEHVYRITATFPRDERFGLTAQLRRAAVSIPSNIGEGKRRRRERVYVHFLEIALGSQGEIDVQLEIARRIGFLTIADYRLLADQADEIGRMLNGLISSIRKADE